MSLGFATTFDTSMYVSVLEETYFSDLGRREIVLSLKQKQGSFYIRKCHFSYDRMCS